MKSFTKIVILILFISGFVSCFKKANYSSIPEIKYLDFTKKQDTKGIDQTGILRLEFIDGDGDIGMDESDTFPPFDLESNYYYNCFIKYFEKQNGFFKEVVLPINYNIRIPYLTPKGQSKSIKGELKVELFINNPDPSHLKYDTICFDVYILDRNLNKSNVIRTPELKIKKK